MASAKINRHPKPNDGEISNIFDTLGQTGVLLLILFNTKMHLQEANTVNIENIVDFSQASVEPERYLPAQEKILKGHPEQTLYNHYNSPCGQLNAGVWEGEVGQWTVNYTEHEYCEIVQGVSVLRDEDGNGKTLRAGDRFVIPAGFKGTWEVLEACRKVYVVFEEKS
jgi:uncharacterized cupin superfamily protein